jgi:hypothetical protein
MSTSPSPVRKALALALGVLMPTALPAQTLTLGAGAPVYGELEEQVTSKKKETAVGDVVRAKVWRNVTVEGRVIIEAGAPIVTRVSMVTPAKVAGRKGEVHLEAVSVRATDGTEILLDGGYDKSGKGRKALSWSLFALVAWPLVFIKGKQAVLEPGTVFDAVVQADSTISLPDSEGFRIKVGERKPELQVEVLYDEMDPDAEQKILPLKLRMCGATLSRASAVTVNERQIEPIPLSFRAPSELGDKGDCWEASATMDLAKLAKHFTKGINRFQIRADEELVEVILEIEL